MKILMVLAHPDDEVVWGYPIVQERRNEVSLVCLSNNKKRHGEGPIKALEEVCDKNDINLIPTERIDNNFYRTPPRIEQRTLRDVISLFQQQVEKAVEVSKPDFIFTHNPMGEYGHGDHRFVFGLISSFYSKICFTDICMYNQCHLSTPDVPPFWSGILKEESRTTCHQLDVNWYEKMKGIYEKYKAWTWGGHDCVDNCFLHFFGE